MKQSGQVPYGFGEEAKPFDEAMFPQPWEMTDYADDFDGRAPGFEDFVPERDLPVHEKQQAAA